MITIVIPTRNRAYTLAKVADSYYVQNHVNEIIFVDDCGDDNTHDIVLAIAENYPNIQTRYIKHSERKGAAAGRITGYTSASNDHILFGEDDAYLETNYTKLLLEKFHSLDNVGLISGRIIYMLSGESQENAKRRFGSGLENKPYLNTVLFSLNNEAIVTGDFTVPFTHALFLTTKALLQKYSYDPFYAKGNGLREETDFQLNVFLNDYKLLVTNDTHCFHLHGYDVPSGGQRVRRLEKLYWNVFYTNYMYDKYFYRLSIKLNISYPKEIAKILFAAYQLYILLIRPAMRLPIRIFQRCFK